MSRWVIKWNRQDPSLPKKANDWSIVLGSASRSFDCYGRAEGRGGETLSNISSGNIALAYQIEDRSFYGVVRIITVHSGAKPPYMLVDRVERFARPVRLATVEEQHPRLVDAAAFHTGGIDSIRRLSIDEYRGILETCGIDAAARERLRI